MFVSGKSFYILDCARAVMGRDREMASDAKRNHYYYSSKIKIEYLDQSAKPLILKSYIREAFPRGLRLHFLSEKAKTYVIHETELIARQRDR